MVSTISDSIAGEKVHVSRTICAGSGPVDDSFNSVLGDTQSAAAPG